LSRVDTNQKVGTCHTGNGVGGKKNEGFGPGLGKKTKKEELRIPVEGEKRFRICRGGKQDGLWKCKKLLERNEVELERRNNEPNRKTQQCPEKGNLIAGACKGVGWTLLCIVCVYGVKRHKKPQK